MTLHIVTIKAALKAFQEGHTLRITLSADRYRQIAAAAAQDGDTPEQAVRALIDAYCGDLSPGSRRNPPGRWGTEPRLRK